MDKPLLVELKSKLFDVSAFAKRHPGGERVLREAAGGDVLKYMSGEEGLLGLRHEHSRAAYEILEKYAIDSTQEVV
jgi:4-hydroxysphinganine ceramide fatty acyl 2-hydroxylase